MYQTLLSRAIRLQRQYAGKHYHHAYGGKSESSKGTVRALFLAAVPIMGAVSFASETAAKNDNENNSKNKNDIFVNSAVEKLLHKNGLRNATSCEGKTETNDQQPQQQSPFCLTQMYDIEQVLGEGAYGMVYRARRRTDGTLVALKTMPREFTGKTDFEREVSALQRLSNPKPHDHIVQLYDLHSDDKNYYLAMELIQGGELLEHLIENGPYSEAVAASFLRQFAEAICHVHTSGLAHADLKPENLLLTSTENVQNATLKVADFGCARSHDLSRQNLHLPAQEFAMGCSFLHMVALGNQFELETLLQERPALVNFRDYDFRTPLHLAASEGHLDICRYLVERGARVNRRDRWGGSPLDDAYRHRHSEVIQYLRQNGATFGSGASQVTKFISAASQGNQEEVNALLEFGSIDLDEGDYDRRTALHLACGEGRMEIVELLCQNGADVNVQDRWGNQPYDDALNAKKNSSEILKILKKYGAKSSASSSSTTPSPDDKQEDEDPESIQRASQRKKETTSKNAEEEFAGTIAYWPPELFAKGARPTPASDMWAVGVIMFVLLTGSHPFDKYADLSDDEVKETLLKMGCTREGHMALVDTTAFDERTEGLSSSCVELLRQLMHPDPEKRMTSDKFLRHPWIQGLTASQLVLGKTHDELKAFWQTNFKQKVIKKFAESLGISSVDALSEHGMQQMFHALDLKKNGVLEMEEMQTVFHELGVSDKDISKMFASVDLDGSGVIRWDEFVALMGTTGGDGPGLQVGYLQQRFKSHVLDKFIGTKNGVGIEKSKLREIFNAIDLDGNGVLDAHDIRVVLRSAGESDDNIISRIVAALDQDCDGRVQWSDFLSIMGVKE